MTYVFSGLNPTNRYNFEGTAIRGGPQDYTNRWTLFEIQEAAGFTAAHTAHALTSNDVPAILPSQCAINTGLNNTAASGDYASWDNILPSSNGIFSITCRQYTNAVPGGSSTGNQSYGMTGIRLEELSADVTPLSIISQPQSRSLAAPTAVTLSVSVTGTSPSYQWYKNGGLLSGKTNAFIQFNPSAVSNSGDYFVIVTNSANSVTSQVATVLVTNPPVIYTNLGLTNHVWRYKDTGENLGDGWHEAEYDDSTWLSGLGILAFETSQAFVVANTHTTLNLTNGSGGTVITYYFRTHFTLTNKAAAVTMVLSNIIDDGAVIYLNGTEVYRFNMPTGPISSYTLANAAATEGVFNFTNVSAPILRQGDNVLAVEVHQNATTSGDIVFGLIGLVRFLAPTPLVITNQPHDVIVTDGEPFTLQVGVSGSIPDYQWFKDGAAIAGANDANYSVSAASPADAGVYLVVVTNEAYAVTSQPVQVTVLPATTGPTLLEANGQTSTSVSLIFNNGLLPNTVTNVANYKITNTFGQILPIVSAILTNGTNVILLTGPRRADANYIVTVNNIAGLSSNRALIAPNSSVPVRNRVLLVAVDDVWEFYDPYPSFEDPDPGSMWNTADYDTTFWGEGAGAFHWGNTPMTLPVNTTLSPSPAIASYFRFPFQSFISPSGIRVEMRTIVDDGAVFYLNGQEFFRTNMFAGAVTYTNTASAAGSLVWPSFPIVVEPSNFREGENIFAVELHQRFANDEKALAVEMFASFDSLVTGPVVLTSGPGDLTVLEESAARFCANVVGAAWFQWQMDDTNLPGATNAALIFLHAGFALDGHRFRVLAGNSQNSVLSSNATLHVVPDRQAPLLLSALVADSTSIMLTFSRALSTASAQNITNYHVTNSAGAMLVITGATLVNETNVVLSFSQPLAGNYFVVVDNLRDTTTSGNFIAPGTYAPVGASYFIPMDAAWKYLIVTTNATVQGTFAGAGYDDSNWSGPSNALLYVETAALPGPKNTLLSLTDSNGYTINTYYFRKPLYAPVGATNVTLRVRHIIDDGCVLHLNGAEFYRYNMPAGPVSAATQASSPAVGDATLLGAYDLPGLTLLPGTNIFAAEVHQNGSASADVVFGVELSTSVPSIAFNPTSLSLRISRWGNQAIVSWSQPAVLESADSLTGPWAPVAGAASPHFISTSNNAATFYRLRP